MLTHGRTTMHDVSVRWLIDSDLAEVATLDRLSFDVPWYAEHYKHACGQKHVIGNVAEVNDLLVGAIVYGMSKERLDIMRLCVHPEWRRCGVGTVLLDHVLRKRSHRKLATARVNEYWLSAQLFFRRRGWRCVETKKDLMVFEYHL